MGRVGQDAWAFGQEKEQSFVSILNERGFLVVPVYGAIGVDAATKAPVVYSPKRTILVSPDILAVRPGETRWVEVKGKTQPGYFFKLQRWEHGIDWHLVRNYREVQEGSGCRVWLAVFEEKSPREGAHPARSEMYAKTYRCLAASGIWLACPLNSALKHGDHRKTWPDGKGGRWGKGGLLWPRSIMQEVKEKT